MNLYTHMDQNKERFYHNTDVLFMLCVQNVSLETILTSLNPIWRECVMMLVSPPERRPTINTK